MYRYDWFGKINHLKGCVNSQAIYFQYKGNIDYQNNNACIINYRRNTLHVYLFGPSIMRGHQTIQ